MINSIKGWLEQIHNLRQRLDPQTAGKRGRATSFSVIDEIEDTFRLYGAVLAGQMIEWTIEEPAEPIRCSWRGQRSDRSSRTSWTTHLLVVRSKGSGKGGTINARLEPRQHGFSITISDDGPGVPEEDRPKSSSPISLANRTVSASDSTSLDLSSSRTVDLYRDDGPLSGASLEAIFEGGVGL